MFPGARRRSLALGAVRRLTIASSTRGRDRPYVRVSPRDHRISWTLACLLGFLGEIRAVAPDGPEGKREETFGARARCGCLRVPDPGRVPYGFDLPVRVRRARRLLAESLDIPGLILQQGRLAGTPLPSIDRDVVPLECYEPLADFEARMRARRRICERLLEDLAEDAGPGRDASAADLARSVTRGPYGLARWGRSDNGRRWALSMFGVFPHSEGRYVAEILDLPWSHEDHGRARERLSSGVAERWVRLLERLGGGRPLPHDVAEEVRRCVRRHRERGLEIVRARDRCAHRFLRPRSGSLFGEHRYVAGLVPVYFGFTGDLARVLPRETWERFAALLRSVPLRAARTVPVSGGAASSGATAAGRPRAARAARAARARPDP